MTKIKLGFRQVVDSATAECNQRVDVAFSYEGVDTGIVKNIDLHVRLEIRDAFQAGARGGNSGYEAFIHPYGVGQQMGAHRGLIFDRRMLTQALRDHFIGMQLRQQIHVAGEAAGAQYFGGQTQCISRAMDGGRISICSGLGKGQLEPLQGLDFVRQDLAIS